MPVAALNSRQISIFSGAIAKSFDPQASISGTWLSQIFKAALQKLHQLPR